jgi:hypothetical protein
VGFYATDTVLDGDARYTLAFVLIGSASIAARSVTRRVSKPIRVSRESEMKASTR